MLEPFVKKNELHVDDRGSVYCSIDEIEKREVPIKRTYVVQNWEKGRIRAWHGHLKAWTGMHVIHGAAKLVAIPIVEDIPEESLPRTEANYAVVLSDKNPGIFWVPPGYYNGSISLVDNTKILVYSTLSFDEVKSDDQRAQLTQNDKVRYFTGGRDR